jgi:hypothetical protein
MSRDFWDFRARPCARKGHEHGTVEEQWRHAVALCAPHAAAADVRHWADRIREVLSTGQSAVAVLNGAAAALKMTDSGRKLLAAEVEWSVEASVRSEMTRRSLASGPYARLYAELRHGSPGTGEQ